MRLRFNNLQGRWKGQNNGMFRDEKGAVKGHLGGGKAPPRWEFGQIDLLGFSFLVHKMGILIVGLNSSWAEQGLSLQCIISQHTVGDNEGYMPSGRPSTQQMITERWRAAPDVTGEGFAVRGSAAPSQFVVVVQSLSWCC